MSATRTILDKLHKSCIRTSVMIKSAGKFGGALSAAGSLVTATSAAIGAAVNENDVTQTALAGFTGGAVLGGFLGICIGLKIGYDKVLPENISCCDALATVDQDESEINGYRRA